MSPDHAERGVDRSPTFDYVLYGLTLQSQFPLPCPPADCSSPPDIRLTLGSDAQFDATRAAIARSNRPDRWFRYARLTDGATYLRWSDVCEFIVSADGSDILCRRLEDAAMESFTVYLLGQVLSFSLLTRGFEPLHGTSVEIDGGAVVFLGDCGEGKSTLAAALLARGFPLLTDDLVVIEERDGQWVVHPGVPRIKLFPSVQRELFGSDATGVPMNSGTTKLVMPLAAEHRIRQTVPLRALYVLSDPAEPVAGRVPVQIDSLQGRDAFMEVTRATFNLLVVERQRLANQFAYATRLSAGAPVRRLAYPRDFSALPAVCSALLADVTACRGAPGRSRLSARE